MRYMYLIFNLIYFLIVEWFENKNRNNNVILIIIVMLMLCGLLQSLVVFENNKVMNVKEIYFMI